jgi:hypothetical protein
MGAAELVGQELSDAAFQAARVSRFAAGVVAAADDDERRFSGRPAAVEFFFEGRSRR